MSNDNTRTATDAEMADWLRLRTDSDPGPKDEQLIAVRLAEKLQADLDATTARAEAAEARAAELEVDRDNWKARADAAEYEVMARPEIDKQFQELNDELIATRAQLAALQAAGEQEKKYELGRLALLAGVVADDEVSAHEMSEQIAQAIITLRAQLAAGEWRPVSEPPGAGMDVEVIVRALIKPNGNYRIVLPALQWRPARDEIDTLWAQLTELEAQLAANAGEWRPVSEAPVTKGRYLTLHFQEGEYPLYDIQHWHDGTVPPGPPAQWHGGWTKGDDWAQPAYWRPLPTPPEAAQ